MNYESKQYENRKLKRLYNITRNKRSVGGAYYDSRKKRFIRYSFNSRYLKKLANRNFRRHCKDILNGNKYRRYFEYKWSLL